MGGLAFFRRTNSPGHWNLASWHSPHSLTWRWLVAFSRFRADEGRWWPVWMPYRTNMGLQWVIRIPLVGFLRFAQQRPMWFRDMHRRASDERERLEKELSRRPRQEIPPRSPFKPTVIDGGNSLH